MSGVINLTESELEIMDLLWQRSCALSRSDIIKFLPEKSWSDSSIHIILNKLLEKGAIKVDGFVKTGRNYGRTYSAAVTQDEYAVMQIRKATGFFGGTKVNLQSIFSALIKDEEIDNYTISELEEILEEKKRELQDTEK
jgi:BlaI family penicillinase repressor